MLTGLAVPDVPHWGALEVNIFNIKGPNMVARFLSLSLSLIAPFAWALDWPVSADSFVANYDGKGLIFGRDTTFCGSAAQPVFGSVSETWVVQPPVLAVAVHAPTTCAPMQPDQAYRFRAGANRGPQSRYLRWGVNLPG